MAVTVTETPGQNPETAPTEPGPAAGAPPPQAPREIRHLDPTAVHKQAAREGLRARLAGQPSPTDAKPGTPAPAAAKPEATAEIDMDPKTLRRITDMSRELRETRTKLTALEAVADKAKNWDEIQAAKGDPKKALGMIGFDLDEYARKLANDEPVEASETAALKAEIDATKAKIDEIEQAGIKKDEAAANAEMQATRAQGVNLVDEHIKGQADRWSFGYKADFSSRVFELAAAAVRALGRNVTEEEGTKITEKAADRVEADFRADDAKEQERRKLYNPGKNGTIQHSSPTHPTPQSRQAPTIDSSIRAVSTPGTPTRGHVSIQEAKRLAREGLRARLNRS